MVESHAHADLTTLLYHLRSHLQSNVTRLREHKPSTAHQLCLRTCESCIWRTSLCSITISSFSWAGGGYCTVHNSVSFMPSPVFLSWNTRIRMMLPRCRLNSIEEEPPLDSTQTSYAATLFLLKNCSLSILLSTPQLQLPPPFHVFCNFVCLLHFFTNTGERGFGLGAY